MDLRIQDLWQILNWIVWLKQHEWNLGKTRSSETIVQKMTLILPGTFGKVRFNVARNFWIDHVAIFNNLRQV